jgi:DNA ligase-1
MDYIFIYIDDIFLLPVLYKTITRGNKDITHFWVTWVQDDIIYKIDADVGGNIKDPMCRKIDKLKRKNAISADEQAKLTAQRDWISQLDKGYKPDDNDKYGMNMYNNVMEQKEDQGRKNTGVTCFKTQSKETKKTNKSVIKVVTPMKGGNFKKIIEKIEKNVTKSISGKTIKQITKEDIDEIRDTKNFKSKVKELFEKKYKKSLVEPKLDGWRCICRFQPIEKSEYEVVLTTQNNKQYPWIKDIKKDLLKLVMDCKNKGIIDDIENTLFDGELYNHDIENRYNQLSSICNIGRKEPHENEDIVQYHIFDIIKPGEKIKQNKRTEMLNSIFKFNKSSKLVHVPSFILNTFEDLNKYLNKFISDGYEGVMVRSPELCYVHSRTDNMFKYKTVEDEEFPIVDATKEKGTNDGCIIWKCKTKSGKTFECPHNGTVIYRRELYNEFKKNPKKFIGKPLTVEYQEYTNDGIPRFPKGKHLRWDVEN